MNFHKIISLSCISLVSLCLLYIGAIEAYKYYREQQLLAHYAQEQTIASQATLVSAPLLAPKKIPIDQPVRILVLEGGGLDGIISSKLLYYLEKESGRPISDLFDIIGGTSVGALQSVALTIPGPNHRPKYSALDVLNILRYQSPTALKITNFDWAATGFGLIAPLINTTHYSQLLKHYFGMTQLSQLTTNVLLTGYDIPNRQVRFFTSRIANVNHDNFLLYQLITGVTAMAGVMPPQQIAALSLNLKPCYLLADPGVIINNPIMAALQYANMLYPKHKKILVFLGMGLDELRTKKSASHYYNGLLGALMEYYNMGWSHDKLAKLFLSQLSQSHAFGLAQLFFIEEDIIKQVGSSASTSPENIANIEKVSDKVVQDHQAQLKQLTTQLKR